MDQERTKIILTANNARWKAENAQSRRVSERHTYTNNVVLALLGIRNLLPGIDKLSTFLTV